MAELDWTHFIGRFYWILVLWQDWLIAMAMTLDYVAENVWPAREDILLLT